MASFLPHFSNGRAFDRPGTTHVPYSVSYHKKDSHVRPENAKQAGMQPGHGEDRRLTPASGRIQDTYMNPCGLGSAL